MVISKPIMGLILAVIVLFVITAISLMQQREMALTVQKLVSDIDQVNTALSEKSEQAQSHYTFADKAAFDQAVFLSINDYIKTKYQIDINEKLELFSLAREDSESRTYGNPAARYSLLEFSDLECPYCKQFQETPMQIVNENEKYVNLQFKHFPLSFHNPAAQKQAMGAECVSELGGNKAFWAFIHDVFTETRGNGRGVDDLTGLARGVGVDGKQFDLCMRSGRQLDKVRRDVQEGINYGISSTPVTVIIDNLTGNRQIIKNVQTREQILSVINEMARSR